MRHRDPHEVVHDILRFQHKLNSRALTPEETHVALAKCIEGLLYILDGQPIRPGFVTEERIEIARQMQDHA